MPSLHLEINDDLNSSTTVETIRVIALSLFNSDPRILAEVTRLREGRPETPELKEQLLARLWPAHPLAQETWDRAVLAVRTIQEEAGWK